jgi:hypothetical protein
LVKGTSILSTIASTALTLAMIAAVLLGVFGARLARGSDRKRGLLMIVAALVLVANVLILTI